jgi:hypothetical protein
MRPGVKESRTPHIDKLLSDAEKAAACQSNPNAIEHVIVAMLRKAKTDPKLAEQLERIYPDQAPRGTTCDPRATSG